MRKSESAASSDTTVSEASSNGVREVEKARSRYVSPAYKHLKKEAMDQLVTVLEQTIDHQADDIVKLKEQEQHAVEEPTAPKKEKVPTKTAISKPVETKATAAKPTVPKVAVPLVRSTDRRQIVAPRSQPGRVAPSVGKRIQKTSVYIGLDFGTTFTKAAYEIAPSNVHIKYSVRFGQCGNNEDYYLPSVLYFDPKAQKLKIFDLEEDCEEIRYFKYNISNTLIHRRDSILWWISVVERRILRHF